ncbi:Uncharacterised protein [Serratia fonticola]|uniref:hypothetical protein n=1 Tax=Serratia fonticola TaxID=47917 RepID=UPI00217BBD4E|nr:hypothetical protein [Serratia fonticola]CAI1853633.1 Uncharacterised protein [Serratia fonticola]
MNVTQSCKESILNPDVSVYSTINNLFRSHEIWPNSVYEVVFLQHDKIPDKFWGLFIKEMFYLVAPGGKIILNVGKKQNKFEAWHVRQRFFNLLEPISDYQALESEHETSHQIVKGTKTDVPDAFPDDIESWSFGLITNGDRDAWVIDFIQSVINQKIPNYEIIICGKVDKLINYGVFARLLSSGIIKVIDFNFRSERGWITKKKNLIAENAMYANMAIFHDRYELDENWFLGMKRYGNNFQVLGCVNITTDGERSEDWSRYPENIAAATILRGWNTKDVKILPSYPIFMDYRDWDENVFIPGGMIIIKKDVWRKVKWDERLYWNEQEDVWLSHMQYFYGIICRFNVNSRVIVKSKRGNNKITLKYSSSKRGLPSPLLRYVLSQCKGIFRRLIK